MAICFMSSWYSESELLLGLWPNWSETLGWSGLFSTDWWARKRMRTEPRSGRELPSQILCSSPSGMTRT